VTTTLDGGAAPLAQPTSAAPAPSPAHRIEYVDGLRAVAVLAVVVHHVAFPTLAKLRRTGTATFDVGIGPRRIAALPR